MNETLIFTVVTLSAIGVVAAVVLYFVAQKFVVFEDPRIGDVEKMLPGANCGGCGYPGCKGLANALVNADDLSGLNCPVGGGETMGAIAQYLGKVAAVQEPTVAIVRCNGSCEKRPRTNNYDGAKSCVVISSLYSGETDCSFGCLGCGDCVSVCAFGALSIDSTTGLPVINEELCTGCGKCASICPRKVIDVVKKGPKGRRVYVACSNSDKGAAARKACSAACIGCGKCAKACPFEAITVTNNVAKIDPAKCRLCRKCVLECPTGAILEVNFPPRPVKKADDGAPKSIQTPASAPKTADKQAEQQSSETKVETTQQQA